MAWMRVKCNVRYPMKPYHNLNQEEERILLHKGTERPGSGQYISCPGLGVYLCKRCDAPLYLSSHQFSSHCGWPSFDDAIEDAVDHFLDSDGERVEICCHTCGGHLGHFFQHEGLTEKNQRHCVNSLSLRFIPSMTQEGLERACLAGGCFWGMEYWLTRLPGVQSCRSGFMGGRGVAPSYEEVCSQKTGFIEVVEVVFDPSLLSYKQLLRYFFEIHDSTQRDRQGPDIGPQYHSAIFFFSRDQHAIAEETIKELLAMGIAASTVVRPGSLFYPAEAPHQQYYEKTGRTPYCHTHHPLPWSSVR